MAGPGDESRGARRDPPRARKVRASRSTRIGRAGRGAHASRSARACTWRGDGLGGTSVGGLPAARAAGRWRGRGRACPVRPGHALRRGGLVADPRSRDSACARHFAAARPCRRSHPPGSGGRLCLPRAGRCPRRCARDRDHPDSLSRTRSRWAASPRTGDRQDRRRDARPLARAVRTSAHAPGMGGCGEANGTTEASTSRRALRHQAAGGSAASRSTGAQKQWVRRLDVLGCPRSPDHRGWYRPLLRRHHPPRDGTTLPPR